MGPHPGGRYRTAFLHEDASAGNGKTADHAVIFEGCFIELIPGEQIVEVVEFESTDPAFAGTMTIKTTLTPVRIGTKVTFMSENMPTGSSAADYKSAIQLTLRDLANCSNDGR